MDQLPAPGEKTTGVEPPSGSFGFTTIALHKDWILPLETVSKWIRKLCWQQKSPPHAGTDRLVLFPSSHSRKCRAQQKQKSLWTAGGSSRKIPHEWASPHLLLQLLCKAPAFPRGMWWHLVLLSHKPEVIPALCHLRKGYFWHFGSLFVPPGLWVFHSLVSRNYWPLFSCLLAFCLLVMCYFSLISTHISLLGRDSLEWRGRLLISKHPSL